ncbi:DUF3592 domain-containing protein [Chitinophaga pinensis]|uniref:DUF3592 domain-containing protein n=1 Tax=Chitinophaga pinensis TaxID=79329 RepID=A0A5C6LNT9_9BACT|nr:DUF3592 domain-containing protein [Chitinophaga pinensis]TWV99144.1 DUF3592 domain-containing protein [Chitinophaga pinensis]
MKRRITWGILLLLTFLTFYYWMPADMYLYMPVFLGIVGGLLCFVFLVQLFADFQDIDEIKEWDRTPKYWYHNIAFLFIPGAIALIVIFSMHYTKLENKELKQFGETVPATIVDGYYKSSSKSSSYKLTISYITKKGKPVRVQKEVSSEQYHAASKGQHVEVIYSTKHPSLVKILLGEEMIKEFTGISSRNVNLKDMSDILDMSGDSVLNTLNKISYRWSIADDDKSSYVNEHKDLYMSVTPHGSVTYVSLGENMRTMLQEIKNSGFKQDSASANVNKETEDDGMFRLYTKGDLKLVVRTKALEMDNSSSSNETSVAAMAKMFNKEVGLVVTMFRN